MQSNAVQKKPVKKSAHLFIVPYKFQCETKATTIVAEIKVHIL